ARWHHRRLAANRGPLSGLRRPGNARGSDCHHSRLATRDHGGRFTRSISVLTARRFPPPWSVQELDACFVVKDGGGQKLAYRSYYEEEPGRRSAAKLLTKDETELKGPGPHAGGPRLPPTIRDLDFRKVLPLLLEPEFPQPAFRPVAAQLAFVRWIVLAVVPGPALSLHFRQPWQALLVQKNKPHPYEHHPS